MKKTRIYLQHVQHSFSTPFSHTHAKERLLYCLDWYMDPYYKKDLSAIQKPLIELLQRIAVTDDDMGVDKSL